MRVHELAKELDFSSKDLIEKLHDLKVEVKSHMSALSDDDVKLIRKAFVEERSTTPAKETSSKATEPTPATPAPTAVEEAKQEEPVAKPEPESTPPEGEEVDADEDDDGLKTLTVTGSIVVREFAPQLGVKPNQLVAELMSMNVFASINEKLELKIAQQLAEKHGYKLQHEKKQTDHKAPTRPDQTETPEVDDRDEDLVARPPVVAFLGHVDHGKTSLLDYIRKSRVAAGEDGGITQHIGAYSVDVDDHTITFLDTPGHEAFTAMRARGANLTDIVVLIVASDDGLMPQTKEAIQHAQAADVCLMVAINKMDLPAANLDRVKQQLQQEGLTPEDWGGDLICCPVSAATGEGVDQLLEMIVLQAEVLELKANPNRRADGFVIEAQLEPGMGPTSSLLVKRGTLKVGDAMVCGPYAGRVKALINDQGKKVRTAGPSSAVKCLGLTNVPDAGESFTVFSNDRVARQTSEERLAAIRAEELGAPKRASLEAFLNQSADSEEQLDLPIVLKADVQGSLEAIRDALLDIKSDKIKPHFVLTGVGNITDNDVLLASASNAVIIGFHVGAESGVHKTAKREGVEIHLYSVIYELIDHVRDAMTGKLKPELREKVTGHAEIRQVFDISKKGRVAGCMVVDGKIRARARARILRGEDVIYEGTLSSLKRFQNDASEVQDGQECGIRLDNFSAFDEGDRIEAYEVEQIAQKL